MLFDMRGRRRNVVKVVYAILAVLMGLSLLLVVGPAPLGDLFGTNTSSSSAADQFEEQTERIEAKLVKDPGDPTLLLSLTKAQVNAGYALSEENPQTGQVVPTTEGRQQLELASNTWSEYLEATEEPSGNLAQIMSTALFALAETSPEGAEAEANVRAAAEAQKIVAEQRPSVNSLTTYALYSLFAFDYAAAEKAKEEAEKMASKSQREQISAQFVQVREQAEEFEERQQERKKLEKELPKVEQELGNGEAGENPLGNALGGGNALSE